MAQYVSTVALEVNGQEITDFKSVREGARTLRKTVNLMNKTGMLKGKERPTVSVDYVVPSDSPEFDFASVEGGTLTIDYQNGRRITYTDVACTEIGETTFDGENEAVRPITFAAADRLEE